MLNEFACVGVGVEDALRWCGCGCGCGRYVALVCVWKARCVGVCVESSLRRMPIAQRRNCEKVLLCKGPVAQKHGSMIE